ncbi:uncharacterized protein LOC123410645 [Hordeum vulgare subsp. vulgare]|uniref:Uncharacterized protein n=1 Tax=Hordeum vulgare subsp. vulgare TaxID=112509 RepID=A0A8I6Z0U8_HORVV|nr:uncharacterized protein LOC123410645 [Hordeum vulgare subsp. vulgare]
MGSSSRRTLLAVLLASSLCASSAAAAPLAAERTRRKDPLDGLRPYAGGWNISDRHYVASVAFSAAPVFAAAAVWFAGLALAALAACCCRCCSRGSPTRDDDYSYSRKTFAASLLLLLAFTATAIVGCSVLYDGQARLDNNTAATLRYVVSQSDGAAASLRGFARFIETAKASGGAAMPRDLGAKVDQVANRVGAAADELAARTASNARKIRTVLDTTRKILIGVAAVMLVLAFMGLVFSLAGLNSVVSFLVFLGWILVTATFILGGVFLLLHNAVGDTCVAMEEWVRRPPDSSNSTALDDILPCADAAATSEALRRSKEVNHQLVATLNGVLANVSNANAFPPGAGPPLNYNQSGPPVPLLCSPYRADLSDRPCAAGEVPAAFAPQAWRGHVCRAAGAPGPEVCATPGRLTPSMYAQALAVANASAGLVGYGPVLAELADCTFVRRAFEAVAADNCPGLRWHSGSVYRSLVTVAAAVAAAVVAWVVHAKERRRRREAVRFRVSPYRLPIEDKSLLKSPRRPYRRAESGGLIGKGGW